MPSARDPCLPDGMKDLFDVIQRQEEEDTHHRQQLRHLKTLLENGPLIVAILAELRRTIDSDLLFTENFELISPKLCEVVDSKWGLALIGHPLAVTERTRERIVELTVQIVWAFLCDNRPRYLQNRDGDGRLEF